MSQTQDARQQRRIVRKRRARSGPSGRHFKPDSQPTRSRGAMVAAAVMIMFVLVTFLALVPGLRANIVALVKMDHPEGQSGVWRLDFSDDFDTGDVSTTKWNRCYPDGGPSGCSNQPEEQWYQPANVSAREGVLHLRARNENAQGFAYTSGMVTTGPDRKEAGDENRFSFKYGYVEARVQVPRGQGLWPAVWLLPHDGTGPPEIDLIEVLGDNTHTSYATVHWAKEQTSKSMTTIESVDFADGWHTVGVRWQADSIEWFYDGIRVKKFIDAAKIPHDEMFVLANLAVGGKWPGPPDASTQFPADFKIDWIRVWKPITG